MMKLLPALVTLSFLCCCTQAASLDASLLKPRGVKMKNRIRHLEAQLAALTLENSRLKTGGLSATDNACHPKSSIPKEYQAYKVMKGQLPGTSYFDGFLSSDSQSEANDSNYKMSSADPRVFGPEAWLTLHRFSIHYANGQTPNAASQAACEGFVTGLPYMVPCPHCAYHLDQFLYDNANLEANGITYDYDKCRGNCTGVKTACSDSKILADFFRRAHNNVNHNNQPCTRDMTLDEVYAKYEYVQRTPLRPIMGHYELAKSMEDYEAMCDVTKNTTVPDKYLRPGLFTELKCGFGLPSGPIN